MKKLSNKRRTFVDVKCVFPESTTVRRTANKLTDLIKAGISDGFDSSTGIFDDCEGDVPEVFDPSISRLELADSLLRGNVGTVKASKVAEAGVTQ